MISTPDNGAPEDPGHAQASEATRVAHRYLRASQRTGDFPTDVKNAATVMCKRMRQIKHDRHVLLATMHDQLGMSWDQIHKLTGIPTRTIRWWAAGDGDEPRGGD